MNLKDFVGGWFIGNFDPSLLKTDDFEVSVKKYKSGDHEDRHIHKIATEYTVIVYGEIEMNGITYTSGDIVVVKPGESTDFRAITDSSNVVVKIPSVKGDKYII